MSSEPAAAPELSATLLLVRDGAQGLEVFLVMRHRRIDFAPGAMVFPGGKVDPEDAAPGLAGRCRGAAGLSGPELTTRVAALREAFEECGVLLARAPGTDALLPAERAASIRARHRRALRAGAIDLPGIVREEDLELACDLPVPFAHWITPEGSPRRYDTHFFLVAAPAGQTPTHDGSESVDSAWLTPARAIAAESEGRHTIVFPTLMQIRKLGRSASVAEAIAAASREPVVTVLPRIEPGDAGPVLRIPAEAGYDVSEAPLAGLMRAWPGRKA